MLRHHAITASFVSELKAHTLLQNAIDDMMVSSIPILAGRLLLYVGLARDPRMYLCVYLCRAL